MSDNRKILDCLYDIKRNSSPWPSTYCACHCGKGALARGGGRCLRCAKTELAEEVGTSDAEQYEEAIRTAFNLEYKFQTKGEL